MGLIAVVYILLIFEKMFNVSSVVLDNSLKMFFNAVVGESLRVCSTQVTQSTERVSAGQLFQIGVAGKFSSSTVLIKENNASRLLSRTMELI